MTGTGGALRLPRARVVPLAAPQSAGRGDLQGEHPACCRLAPWSGTPAPASTRSPRCRRGRPARGPARPSTRRRGRARPPAGALSRVLTIPTGRLQADAGGGGQGALPWTLLILTTGPGPCPAALSVGVPGRASCAEIPSSEQAEENVSETNTLPWSITMVSGTMTGSAAVVQPGRRRRRRPARACAGGHLDRENATSTWPAEAATFTWSSAVAHGRTGVSSG